MGGIICRTRPSISFVVVDMVGCAGDGLDVISAGKEQANSYRIMCRNDRAKQLRQYVF